MKWKAVLVLLFLFLFFQCFGTHEAKAQQNCVAIAGDSVEYGNVLLDKPDGSSPVTVVNTGSVGSFISGISVVDKSVPAARVGSYDDSGVVNSNCKYVVIGPWVNDLGIGDASSTVSGISKIINDLKNKDSNIQAFVVNYYTPQQPFRWASNIWPAGFASSRVGVFNNAISSSFSGKIIDVSGFGPSDTATSVASYPGITADGVHLSVSGKQKLAGLIGSAANSSTNGSTTPNISGSGQTGDLASEIKKIQADNKYIAALLFDAFETNSAAEFAKFIMTDPDIRTVCGGPCGKIGINSAIWYSQGNGFYDRAKGLGMLYSLEIAKVDVDTVLSGLNAARNHGITPIIRIGVTGDSGGFTSDPRVYVRFLQNVDLAVDFPVLALAGPNEAEAEGWATPACGSDPICIGKGVTDYMKTVVAGAGNLTHVKLLSPAFNMTSSVSVAMVKEMVRDGAPFGSVSAIAGNSYNFGGKTITGWVDDFMAQTGLAGKSILLTEIGNIDNTSKSATALKEFIPTQVPCDSGDSPPLSDPEFHSLRPYPATPCYKQIKQTAWFCANQIVAKNSYHYDAPTGNCTTDANGDQTCIISLAGQSVGVSVDLTNAKLPVLGNTEDVPNATWTSLNTTANNLSAAERMNNYVSWYLNGVVNRAEEDFSSWDPTYLVNFSGPLNKLLSWDSQFTTRDTSVDNANKTIGEGQDTASKDVNARHSQIVGCPILENHGVTVPCYLFVKPVLGLMNFLNSIGVQFRGSANLTNETDYPARLADWNGHKPPDENDPKYANNFAAYWKDYQGWVGQICTPQLFGTKFYFCVNSPAVSIWSMLFNHISSSTTEDRIGQVFTDKTITIPTGITLEHTDQSNQTEVKNVSFVPDPASTRYQDCQGPNCAAAHNLYFAHTQEVAELAKSLQNTFATKPDATDKNNWEAQIKDDIEQHDLDSRGQLGTPVQGCEQVQTFTNPGDKLYGNLTDKGFNDPPMKGSLNFDTTFTCKFTKTSDPSAVQTCISNGGDLSICSTQGTKWSPCNHDVFVSMSLFTKSPLLQENYDRLVNGAAGIFKRFYPQIGPNSPVETLKDIPGTTTVSYSASGGGANDSVTTLAGDPNASRGGDSAQLFFPHLGSIESYFLQGIQKALRPLGFDNQPLAGAPNPPIQEGGSTIACPGPRDITQAPSSNSCNINCDPNAPSPPSQWLALKEGVHHAINQIVAIDDPRSLGNQIDKCFNDVVDQSLKAGVNPIFTLAIWAQESGASNYVRFGCGERGVQDFGVNSSQYSGFQAQLTHFLSLPYAYPNDPKFGFTQCFTNGCSLENFAQAFQQGQFDATCSISSAAGSYAAKTQNNEKTIAPNCEIPAYPTQMTSCH